jgi:CDP-diacylglycerol--glycerol-3-phosphate 3-phosphatidyltransferase
MVLVPVFLVLFFAESPVLQFLATVTFIAGAITDHWDGKLARRRQEITKFGRFADPLADKFLTLATFIAILVRQDFKQWYLPSLIYVIIIAVREFGITFLRMWAITKDTPLITSFWGKMKTTVQLIALIFSLLYFNARDLSLYYGLELDFLRDALFIPVLHFLFLISMLVTVFSGILYLTPASFEKKTIKGGYG